MRSNGGVPVRRTVLGAVALALACAASACSSGSPSSSGDAHTYTIWDPYSQYDASTPWAKALDKCGSDAGVTIKRTAFDGTDLTTKVLLAAQQGNAPDVAIVDNPVVSTLAGAGVLTDTGANKLDTSSVKPNLLAPGVVDGKTYGIPVGANTLALYYNEDLLKSIGVDPTSVTSWDTLTAALRTAKNAGKTGIAFSAISTEEGTFQFLPWFWGNGANLTDLASPQAVEALTLWTDWLKNGYAQNSVINDNQTASWQAFASGQVAFAENGTWQLSNAHKLTFKYGVIPIPGKTSGTAPGPTGGEFVTVPVRADTSRYATSAKLASCLVNPDNAYTTDSALSYVGVTDAVQAKQVSDTPELKPWVTAVQVAKGRTGDNLGTKYPKISEQLWKAVQSALSGSASPQAALSSAQTAAQAATR